MRNMTGVIVVVPTPFDEDGRIDDASLERLIGHYLSLGVQGLTIMGVMGEGSKLSTSESEALMQRIFSLVRGQVPVIVGASNPDDAICVAIANQAMELGAASVMIAPKRGLVGDPQVHDYFAGLCNRLGPNVPICVQDYPPVTGVTISVAGLAHLFQSLPQLEMLKLEDMPGLDKLTQLLRSFADTPASLPAIFVGNNALFTELELARGAHGVMTGFAFPEMLLQVYERHKAGDLEGAADIYEKYLPLIRYEMQPNLGLAARKYVLQRQGLLACSDLREPGYKLTPEDRAEIDRMLARLERRRAAE